MSMISEYLSVLMLMAVALTLVGGILIASAMVGKRAQTNPAKDSAYECGLKPVMSQPHVRFSIHFYLVALLFVLFDIEVVFLYPWAVVFKEMIQSGLSIFISMLSFVGILFVGFVYALKKGAFQWK